MTADNYVSQPDHTNQTTPKTNDQLQPAMKRILSIAMLFGAAHLASAGTTNIYFENWGANNTAVQGNGLINVSTVGWIGAIAGGGDNATGGGGSNTAGPYFGSFADTGAVDFATGNPLAVNTVYFTSINSTNQSGAGMFYTTDTAGAGSVGTTAFVDINPADYTNLSFSAEVNGSATGTTNYFAMREGTIWYVSTTPLTGSVGLGGAQFSNNVVPYNSAGTAWNLLTTNATSVTIGPPASGILFGPITGFGIVTLPTGGGWNFNQLAITAFAPNPPPPVPATVTATPISQTVFAGGGAQFLMTAAGSNPKTYTWQGNGVTLTDGSKYSGTATNILTISNCNSGDAAIAYTVGVTNSAGGQTVSGFTLTVNPLPAGTLYNESYPYIGVTGNLPLTGVGWANVSITGTVVGIFQSGTGLGAVFDYSPSAGVNLNYTTDTNDTGFSGLPFVDINPANFPAVTLQAQFSPGNGAGQVAGAITAYWAVQMTGGLWYSSVKPIPISIVAQNNYLLDQLAFTTTPANWNTLTVSGGTVTIGSQAANPLSGNITGAGIIMVHNDTTGASMNWENFAITTNAVTQLPPLINSSIGLYSQGVPTGGGASFAVTTSQGALPITYSWSLNGVMLTNGGRISGATSPTLTIANTTLADNDATGGQSQGGAGNVIAYVSNSIGTDNSANYYAVSLFVTNAPIGQLYTEQFPYTGPSGNMAITADGWTEAVSGTPNAVFLNGVDLNNSGLGAAFAYFGSAATTVYYATSTTDTNQAGIRFPSINPAFYPGLTFAVDIAPSSSSSNVTAFLAVEMNSNTWYVAASPLPVPTATDSGTYANYPTTFNPAASGWKNLTITSSGGIVGSAASSKLTGLITGAGVAFVTVGSGGDFNFRNFTITGTGLGGINVGPLSGTNVNLSWVGNPAVNLQSSTSLTVPNWTDVPNTLGLYGQSVPANVPQKYYRLVAH
jgi:Immunoglobulin I-set domain